jgi:sialidase-1
MPFGHTGRRLLAAVMTMVATLAPAAAPAERLRPLLRVDEAVAAEPEPLQTMLFDGGSGGDHSYRIPSLLRTTKGTLLAFAEARVGSNRDWGNINLVFKRSEDNGVTWSPLGEVVGTGPGTWGNPTGVVDRDTGTIFLFVAWNPAGYSLSGDDGTLPITEWGQRRIRVFTSSADEDGTAWHGPDDITEQVTPKTHADGTTWAWDAVGPGTGVQTTGGRLIIPATNRNIYSDDHGAHWQAAPFPPGQEVTGESTIVELTDGRLMRNDTAVKRVWDTAKTRWVTRGTIEGGFDAYASEPALPDPHARGSILRYNVPDPARLVFLNSASTSTRTAMTIRISLDEGQTWPIARPLGADPLKPWTGMGTGTVKEGGYSSMAKTTDFAVGMLVEVNEDTGASDTSHRSIVFRKVKLAWITG